VVFAGFVVLGDAALEHWGELVGRDGILDGLRKIDRFSATQHSVHNQLVEISGDAATGETYCTAHHLYERDGTRRKLSWGIRYQDRCVRERGAWRYERRELLLGGCANLFGRGLGGQKVPQPVDVTDACELADRRGRIAGRGRRTTATPRPQPPSHDVGGHHGRDDQEQSEFRIAHSGRPRVPQPHPRARVCCKPLWKCLRWTPCAAP